MITVPDRVALVQVIAETFVGTAKKPKSVTTLSINPIDNFILLFIFVLFLFGNRLIILNFFGKNSTFLLSGIMDTNLIHNFGKQRRGCGKHIQPSSLDMALLETRLRNAEIQKAGLMIEPGGTPCFVAGATTLMMSPPQLFLQI